MRPGPSCPYNSYLFAVWGIMVAADLRPTTLSSRQSGSSFVVQPDGLIDGRLRNLNIETPARNFKFAQIY